MSRWGAPGEPDDAGGWKARLSRAFGGGSNPFTWALFLYSAWGIRVRLHLFFLVYIAAQVLVSFASQEGMGPGYILLLMGALFGLVLLHEYGHCFTCRAVRGEADEIILWPLGGLAMCRPPHDWRAHLWTTLGGPAVNVALLPVFAAALLIATGGKWGAVVFNPFAPGVTAAMLTTAGGDAAFWLTGLWWLHYINFLLLAFNMLLPMYPMDAGRVVQALIWRSAGYQKSMEISTTLGLLVAGVLFVFAMVAGETLLMAIAIFGGFTCWAEKQRLKFEATAGGVPGVDLSAAYDRYDPKEAARDAEKARKAREKEEAEFAEIDRILSKIREQGMGSLTRKERRLLSKETERKRNSGRG